MLPSSLSTEPNADGTTGHEQLNNHITITCTAIYCQLIFYITKQGILKEIKNDYSLFYENTESLRDSLCTAAWSRTLPYNLGAQQDYEYVLRPSRCSCSQAQKISIPLAAPSLPVSPAAPLVDCFGDDSAASISRNSCCMPTNIPHQFNGPFFRDYLEEPVPER